MRFYEDQDPICGAIKKFVVTGKKSLRNLGIRYLNSLECQTNSLECQTLKAKASS